jgi:putative transposase
MLLRLAYLGITNAFALLRLLPGSDRDKDAEILVLRHQLAVLHRQLDGHRVRFDPADRAWLAALLHRLPMPYPAAPAAAGAFRHCPALAS